MPTIGVAIAVPDPYATQLREQRESFGDCQARSIPSHITLVPPTTVDPAVLDVLEGHLAAVAGRHGPFDVRLRGTGTFRPVSSVVFVTVAAGISECELLAQDVRTGPLAVPLEFPYHPHVTVAHDIDDDGLDRAFDALVTYECRFAVDAFVLFEHDAEVGWSRRRAFTLVGASS
ncbi:MAG: 2'-5' RNA ligase family protein [Nocardioidaceae bacterium]|nr:2'-5' RNA ligase family protein [Nocardioidaceae bacterium]